MYFSRSAEPSPDGPRPRVLVGEGPDGPWVDLRVAERVRLDRGGADATAAVRVAEALVPGSLSAGIAAGGAFLEAALAARRRQAPGTNLDPAEAEDHTFGFTILNDFSAGDIQFREMAGRLGPCKSKHFAWASGLLVATIDELDWRGDLRM